MQCEQPKKVAACLIGGLIRTSKVKSTRPNRVVRQGKAAAASAPSAASVPSAALREDDSADSTASAALREDDPADSTASAATARGDKGDYHNGLAFRSSFLGRGRSSRLPLSLCLWSPGRDPCTT